MSINFNPGPKILALIDQGGWHTISNYTDLANSVTGTGSVEKLWTTLGVITGTTASSTARARSSASMFWSKGKDRQIINWSKKIVLQFPIAQSSATTNGVGRFTLGKDTANGIGGMDEKGIGIQIDDDALKGIVHDGTSGNTIDLSVTLTDEQAYLLTIVSDGAGNVEWFVDGISKGASSDGPTGDSPSGNTVIQLEAANNADSATQVIRLGPLSTYVEQ